MDRTPAENLARVTPAQVTQLQQMVLRAHTLAQRSRGLGTGAPADPAWRQAVIDLEAALAGGLDLRQALDAAQRIQQLGGVPVFRPQEIAQKAAEEDVRPEQGATLSDMVVENLMLERHQIEAYTSLIREIGDGDPTTRRILGGILETTEQHASELADYLKRTSDTSR